MRELPPVQDEKVPGPLRHPLHLRAEVPAVLWLQRDGRGGRSEEAHVDPLSHRGPDPESVRAFIPPDRGGADETIEGYEGSPSPFRNTHPSGGKVMFTVRGRPCAENGKVSTPPRLPTPDPP